MLDRVGIDVAGLVGVDIFLPSSSSFSFYLQNRTRRKKSAQTEEKERATTEGKIVLNLSGSGSKGGEGMTSSRHRLANHIRYIT